VQRVTERRLERDLEVLGTPRFDAVSEPPPSADETPFGQAALVPAMPGFQRGARLYRRISVIRAFRNPASDWSGLRILCYHRMSNDRDVLSLSPALFRRQLEYALGSGAKPVRLIDALRDGTIERQGRSFCVTFDDGYEDMLTEALPVLRDLAVPATVYLPTAIIGGTARPTWYRSPPTMLDWAGVDELRSDGLIDAGSHSRTHPALPRLDEATARAEITGSRHELTERLGDVPSTFCYPAGLYGPRERRLVAEAGYEGAVTVHAGVNAEGADRYALARTLVYGGEPLSAFAARFDGRLDAPSPLRARVLRRRARGYGTRTSDLH
jgi:peptidoglycan/xylan/chitin deacetylase (PgdA/CDA1 family)